MEDWMSDGREERKEQEERRRWQEPKDLGDDLDRDWPREDERERRDSSAVPGGTANRIGRLVPTATPVSNALFALRTPSVGGFTASASYNRLFT
jgi:hypothetical protein